MLRLTIDFSKFNQTIEVNLPASKSVSNRVLMIHGIAGFSLPIQNLSEAEDTVFLQKIIQTKEADVFSGAGGTTIRFYVSFCYLKNKPIIIRGDETLNSRPISPLVDALSQLGAEIVYLEKNGCAPIQIISTEKKNNKVVLTTNISSQFVSALLLIAPYLPNGLELYFPEEQVSRSYISMTTALMNYYGVEVAEHLNSMVVKPQQYIGKLFTVPSDWSAVIYWMGILSIKGNGSIFLKNLRCDGLQGDELLMDWMLLFGITSTVKQDGILLEKTHPIIIKEFNFDLINNPDLAQGIAVIGAALGIKTILNGLSTLKYKETDRLFAIKTELQKTGVDVLLSNDSLEVSGKIKHDVLKDIVFDTYNDHRMAMSLAMLSATGANIKLNNPEVVSKSYPGFFEELKKFCVITEQ